MKTKLKYKVKFIEKKKQKIIKDEFKEIYKLNSKNINLILLLVVNIHSN